MSKTPIKSSTLSFPCASGISFQDVTKVHPELKNFFAYCLVKVAILQRANLEAKLASENILPVHLGIIKVLEAEGSSSQVKIGDSLGIDKASMVKLVDHLESLNIVVRKPDLRDRRVNLLNLTDHGKKVFARAKKLSEQSEKEFLSDLSDKETKSLKSILAKLLR